MPYSAHATPHPSCCPPAPAAVPAALSRKDGQCGHQGANSAERDLFGSCGLAAGGRRGAVFACEELGLISGLSQGALDSSQSPGSSSSAGTPTASQGEAIPFIRLLTWKSFFLVLEPVNPCKVLRQLEDGLQRVEEIRAPRGQTVFNKAEGAQSRYCDALKRETKGRTGLRISAMGHSFCEQGDGLLRLGLWGRGWTVAAW